MRLLKYSLVPLVVFYFARLTTASSTRCSSHEAPQGKVSFISQEGSGVVEMVKQLYPETRLPDTSVVLNTGYLYTVTERARLNIAFVHSGGVIRSSLSYYQFNPNWRTQETIVLFPDQACARIGDVVTIGPFETGAQIGFTITSPQNVTTGGHLNPTFWSDTGRLNENPDNISHVSVYRHMDGKIFVGFEDQFGGGDRDFNDVIVAISADPESPCGDTSWCRGSFLGADLAKILGFATGLGLAVERILEVMWSIFNVRLDRRNPQFVPFNFQYQPAVIGMGHGIVPFAPPAVPNFGPYGLGPGQEEEDAVQFDELNALIKLYESLCPKKVNYVTDYMECIHRKARFQARVMRQVNMRIVISLILGILLGFGFAAVANCLFGLCWCIKWIAGIGMFACVLSPFIHQLFQLAFGLQRYLKEQVPSA